VGRRRVKSGGGHQARVVTTQKGDAMLARCPNDPTHKRFVTVAHVTEDWVVDERGNFLQVSDETCGETTHGPHPENGWSCDICGAEAIVTDE
jgi:ribosomal protein S27E